MLLRRRNDAKHPFQLVLLDAGITAELQPRDRENLLALFQAVLKDDGEAAARLMVERSRGGLRPVRQKEFEKKMGRVVTQARAKGLRCGGGDGDGDGGLSGLLRTVLGLCYEHRVKLEPHFVSVVLSVAIMEGLGKRLDPDLDLIARAAPFIAKAAARAALSR